MAENSQWFFWADVGGTFTDTICKSPAGVISTRKILSSSSLKRSFKQVSHNSAQIQSEELPPDFYKGYNITINSLSGKTYKRQIIQYDNLTFTITWRDPLPSDTKPLEQCQIFSPEPSPIFSIRLIMKLALHTPIPRISLKLATTRGTNALLERKGSTTALLVTEGFKDHIRIGNGTRPELFSLIQPRIDPLAHRVYEVNERVFSDGTIDRPIIPGQIKEIFAKIKEEQISSIAISLLNSYTNQIHENEIKSLAHEAGFSIVKTSSEVSKQRGYLARTHSVVAEAFLAKPVTDYLKNIDDIIKGSNFKVMTSAGSIMPWQKFRSIDSLLSGPAGGALAVRETANRVRNPCISIDMGGTSTDIMRYEDSFNRRFITRFKSKEHAIDTEILSPSIAIETIAAGGGSICWIEKGHLKVGPASAGAHPGPACYGNGGPLTITDMNLFLGRMATHLFPFKLQTDIVEKKLKEQCQDLRLSGASMTPVELANAYVTIACANTAAAIDKVTQALGYKSQDHHLVSFGGAGGQIACQTAEMIGTGKIHIPAASSVLSAWGLSRSIEAPWFETFCGTTISQESTELPRFIETWHTEVINKNPKLAKISPDKITVIIDIKYTKQNNYLSINRLLSSIQDISTEFNKLHKRYFGYNLDEQIEVGVIRLSFQLEALHSPLKEGQFTKLDVQPSDTSLFDITDLPITGPAILHIENSSVYVKSGWVASQNIEGLITLDRKSHSHEANSDLYKPLAITLLSNRLSWIAEQMGTQLKRTAFSVNIKDREDFSCALFSSQGDLLVNAPHIPVHLGSMGDTIRAIINFFPQMDSRHSYICNHPFMGGSHLNDITVITPIFRQDHLLGFVANRAHHAEVGGLTPGSMPPKARYLHEEGIIIEPFQLELDKPTSWDELERMFCQKPYPSRGVNDNIADIRGQIAANLKGLELCNLYFSQLSEEKLQTGFSLICKRGEEYIKEITQTLVPQKDRHTAKLENGSQITVSITISNLNIVHIDFSGTSPTSQDNFNANPAIVKACVLYVMRSLAKKETPLNQGFLNPIKITIPKGSILNPIPDTLGNLPATSAGNVETSQAIVDLLLNALGVCASSQGTMNNVLFGSNQARKGFGFYETMGGGSGAGPHGAGSGPHQVHMTNTHLTDPEVFESRYPARITLLKIRKDSGGAGKFKGGNGMIREYEFNDNLEVCLITSHRKSGPKGLNGGKCGLPGKNQLKRVDSPWESAPAVGVFQVRQGDRLRISTPGGGGYGDLSKV